MTIIEKLFDKKPSDKELSCFIADMISMKGYQNMDAKNEFQANLGLILLLTHFYI